MKEEIKTLVTQSSNHYNEETGHSCQHIQQQKSTNDRKGIRDKEFYIESYGCQMNFADTEVITSIMNKSGFSTTKKIEDAAIVFLNTCSIREKAETTIRNRLSQLKSMKKQRVAPIIGILGCMAERLKTQLLEEEKIVDLIAGPDSYRDLPNLIAQVNSGQRVANTILSREETYEDIIPVRLDPNGISAYVSITRGCDNMCTFCVVPFTRGRERSRSPNSIVNEAKDLFANGYKEVTLLGQNVDSYKWSANQTLKGKAQIEKAKELNTVTFHHLLEMVAQVSPQLRVRFSTSHPKDISENVLFIMKKYKNICNNIHLPAQSGNTRILTLMNRTYTREWYINKIDKIRSILGQDCGISSDIITGFCTETEKEHQDTLTLMDYVKYDLSYMFYYSERKNTYAERKLKNDIPLTVKKRRLSDVIAKQQEHSLSRNTLFIGKTQEVLIEGYSKRSNDNFYGRTGNNKVAIFPVATGNIGDYVDVLITDCTAGTLLGRIIKKNE